jgi:aryl-alcohol dehydrogenase-like predicted oxidoreductase
VVARANTLAEWRDWTPFSGLQVPYNLLRRDIERELLPMAEALGLTVTAWAPLAAGVLAGSVNRVDPARLDDRERAAAKAVREVAAELSVEPAQVALAWTMAKSRAVLPLVGISKAEQLAAHVAALDLVLPAEAITRLEAAVDFALGFPGDFIAECEPSPFAFGDAATRVVSRQQP